MEGEAEMFGEDEVPNGPLGDGAGEVVVVVGGKVKTFGEDEVPNGSLGDGAGEVIVVGGGKVTASVAGFGDGGGEGRRSRLLCIRRLWTAFSVLAAFLQTLGGKYYALRSWRK